MRELRLAMFVVVGLCLACGDDDGGERRKVSKHTCHVEQTECDIQETECLESLLELAACARENDTPDLPDVRHISTADFAQQIRQEAQEKGFEGTPWDLVLPELSLQPRGKSTVDSVVDVLAESVVAFYDDETKGVTILTDSKANDPIQKMDVVMHEFTHYLQDRTSGLSDLRKHAGASSDAHAALLALIEGDATVNSTRGLVYLMSHAPRALNWDVFFDSLEESLIETVEGSDAPLYAATQFLPYVVGSRFISYLWEKDDRSMVTPLFDEWPHSLRDWMVGLPWESGSTTQKPLDCGPPLPAEGFTLYEVDSLGVAGAFALLTAAGHSDLELASALQHDAFAVYLDESEADDPKSATRVVGVWRMRFDSGALANYLKTINSLGLDTRTFKNELVIRVASDASIAAMKGDALATCPKLADLKPMRTEASVPNAIRQLVH